MSDVSVDWLFEDDVWLRKLRVDDLALGADSSEERRVDVRSSACSADRDDLTASSAVFREGAATSSSDCREDTDNSRVDFDRERPDV